MHVKLMLLRFTGFLRIVVSSLNLSERQWSDAGDSFWYADLPFEDAVDESMESQVQAPIMDLLENMFVPKGWISLVRRCRWKALQQQYTRVAAITSIPDEPDGVVSYGLERLKRLLSSLPKFPPFAQAPVYVQVWSLGNCERSMVQWYASWYASTLMQAWDI